MSVDSLTTDAVSQPDSGNSTSRVDVLEDHLKTTTSLNFRQVSRGKMNKVDNAETTLLFSELFFELSEGTFPENQDGIAKPPTQEEFVDEYFERSVENGNEMFTEELEDAWKRRLELAYPSFVRDLHFTLLLQEYNKEHQVFDSVTYSIEDDIQGADIVVRKDGEEFHINCYVDSKKSKKFLKQKKEYRQEQTGAEQIFLPMKMGGSNATQIKLSDGNGMWLYDASHIQTVVNKVRNQKYDDECVREVAEVLQENDYTETQIEAVVETLHEQ